MRQDYRLPEPIRLGSMYSYTISHGLHLRSKYDGFRIPDFQRDLVWTIEQKQLFIESIYLELPIGSYCYHQSIAKGVDLVLLDGQQRWNAIFSFVDGEFAVFGYHWKDLTLIEQRVFTHGVFPARVVEGLSYEQQREVFERLAYGGTPNVRATVEGN